ncbi:MAG: DNA repair protein RadA [Gammaproteobacteria bacterium]
MAKPRTTYSCGQCGAQHLKWQGQCPDCGAWNSLAEQTGRARESHYAGESRIERLDAVEADSGNRMPSGLREFDRVLGGGLVPGSVVLIGGDPGIGKSTLLLKVLAALAAARPVCYVTGEESLAQIGLRAQRLGVAEAPVELLAETQIEAVLGQLQATRAEVIVVDSVQTLYTETLQSAPGSVSQLRECAAALVRFAKTRQVTVILVGHVTKEGTLAGPRVLEHMVDTVLYFESDVGSRFRIVRAAKNRFGAANELGFFAMTEQGFTEVRNPSAIFLAQRERDVAGTATLATREGTRTVLVEVQALVDQSGSQGGRRIATGLDAQRLGLLLAVVHRHCGIALSDCDVYANAVGGLRIFETAADLAVTLAVLSSLRERPLSGGLVVFGEVGLTGEVRPVPFGEERLIEAAKHGFTRAIVPRQNAPKRDCPIEVVAVERLTDAIAAAFEADQPPKPTTA